MTAIIASTANADHHACDSSVAERGIVILDTSSSLVRSRDGECVG